jgi:hypothetical protein
MTQYLLAVHGTTDDVMPNESEMKEIFAAVDRFNDKLKQIGAWVFAGGLTDVKEAKVVDASKGEATVTDGPFSETREVLGGFWVVEAADLDAALALAKEGSAACAAAVEVRAFAPV